MVGRTISHYTIIEKLGEGGMGVVYKARDTRLDRFVAIKILPPKILGDAVRKQRFIQEAKSASALSHPNIIHIYEIGEADGVDYIAMEFVAGKTLQRLIPRRGMPFGTAVTYCVQIADALATAHAAGIIHRDLKPGNVMINDQELVKVLDFGLAKLTEAMSGEEDSTRTLRESVTEEGTIVGTAAYMSPEQSEGKKVDARSDIFSFGSMLYEMLTGRRAFQRDTTASTLAAILLEDPKLPSQIAEDLPAEIDRIVKRCLRKDPPLRFQHMADLKVALSELKQESDSRVLARPAGKAKMRRRPVLKMAAVMVALLATILGAWWFLRSNSSSESEPVPVPLTTYPGTEDDPSFSPDGTQVAFTWCKDAERKKCNIYVKQIGVEPPSNLTGLPAPEYSPAWSPDGRFIAFLRNISPGRSALIIVPQRGGHERVLGEMGIFGAGKLSSGPLLTWTPDSKWIAVSEVANTVQGLVLHSVDTGETRTLTSPPDVTVIDVSPAFSADGYTLAFTREAHVSDIYLLHLAAGYRPDSAAERLVLKNPFNARPIWMGDELLYLSGTESSMGLWRVNVRRASSARRYVFADRNIRSPTVSTQSRRLAYSLNAEETNIWRVDLRGPNGKLLQTRPLISSTRSDYQPAYSPNGKRIAFVSERSGVPELWVCDHDGSNPIPLTSFNGPQIYGPRWSWDSQNIAFYVPQEGNSPNVYI